MTSSAMAKARILLTKTRNWESWNWPLLPRESSYWVVMIFSCRYPHVLYEPNNPNEQRIT